MSDVSRHNWREHCTEAELTGDEREELHALSLAITEEAFDGGGALFDFIDAHTRPEYDAHVGARLPTAWAGFPAYVDICRRRDRAEIRAWQEWGEQAATPEQLALDVG